jgi:hypothetical protein
MMTQSVLTSKSVMFALFVVLVALAIPELVPAISTQEATAPISLQDAVLLPAVFKSGSWVEVGTGSATGGGISNDDGFSYSPSIAVAPDGTVYVAWHSDNPTEDSEIYIRRWNGSSWEEVGAGSATGGGISNNSGSSAGPFVSVAPDGIPYVAWTDFSLGNPEIYIRRWNGSSWEEVGAGSASGGGISNNLGSSYGGGLAVAPDGTPYVVWSNNTSAGDPEIFVRRWNGSNWEEVGVGSATGGGISNDTGSSYGPSIAIASSGTPYIAWENEDIQEGYREIYIRRWNGSSWEEVGASSASGGGISNNSGFSAATSTAVAPDGTPYVAWQNYVSGDNNYEIYIRRWNGSSWEEVGAGSATGGGISNTSGYSEYPSLVIAPDGTLTIAWRDDSSGNAESYVRQWRGANWEEIGSNSASEGGISNNGGNSYEQRATLAPNGTPYVAWMDNSNGNWEIYVRRWQE